MPGAQWVPSPNHTQNAMLPVRYVVLHIMEGTLAGTDSWFGQGASQVSAHFGVGKAGELHQYVDTADKAWAEAEGNPVAISIECEGQSGDSLTSAQLATVANVVAWVHKVHGVPLVITDDPSSAGAGLGWHGMGGTAWGNHPSCPGDPIKSQRAAILSMTAPAPAPTTSGAPTMAILHAHVPLSDANGSGYIYLARDLKLGPLAGKVGAVSLNGGDPSTEGYAPKVVFAWSDRGTDVLVEWSGATPKAAFDIRVLTLAS